MLAKVNSGAVVGLDAVPVEVEVDLTKRGMPAFTIVGLGNKAVQEAKERVTSAIINSSADFPKYRLTVNLAPADLPKQGPAYDLPIALGTLIVTGQIPLDKEIDKSLVLGELSLDGSLRPTPGVLPLTLLAKKQGFAQVFLPAANAKEAAIVKDISVFPVSSLAELFYHFTDLKKILPHPEVEISDQMEEVETEFDFSDVRGQEHVKRALEIAAAGSHNVFMSGPPGAGKTLLARTLPSILPKLTIKEAIELTKIYSITGKINLEKPLVTQRPFRSPHHTTSRIGLIGGGSKIQPGEISLAHRGVLFLDEFPELPRSVLESLRQPMEDGVVQVTRAAGSLTFPAQFMLVAAANPCPCGFYGSSKKRCICTMSQIEKYRKRISGPILDRIDIHVEVPFVEVEKLIDGAKDKNVEDSNKIRVRVQKARDRQTKRFDKGTLTCNSEMTAKNIKKFCPLNSESIELLRQAMLQLKLSARGYHKIIKVARTISDLAGNEEILPMHISEALQYREKERE